MNRYVVLFWYSLIWFVRGYSVFGVVCVCSKYLVGRVGMRYLGGRVGTTLGGVEWFVITTTVITRRSNRALENPTVCHGRRRHSLIIFDGGKSHRCHRGSTSPLHHFGSAKFPQVDDEKLRAATESEEKRREKLWHSFAAGRWGLVV